MPSIKYAPGTSVPTAIKHNPEQLAAQREANDAAACAGMLSIMGPVWPPSAPSATSALSVDRLMQAAFYNGRTPRSAEYKAGTRMALAHRIERIDIVPPYEAGTAAADAFFAGLDEGKRVWRAAVAKIGGAA